MTETVTISGKELRVFDCRVIGTPEGVTMYIGPSGIWTARYKDATFSADYDPQEAFDSLMRNVAIARREGKL